MRQFDEIFDISAARKGGSDALENLLIDQGSTVDLTQIADDRWLSQFTKRIFQAGFNWKIVEAKWDGFEAAFQGFDLGYCAMLHDEALEELISNKAIIRHGAKIKAVQHNAGFLMDLAKESGSVGKAIANWPGEDYVGLLQLLKKQGSRLGGNTGQYALRFIGRDGFILSRDVVTRLIAEGVIDKQPGSQKSMKAIQEAFNIWKEQSGRSLTQISRVLAMSTG